MTVCACMGPQGSDPVCPCRMRAMGKQPSNQWTEEDRYRLTETLKDIFQAEDHMSDKGYEEASLEDPKFKEIQQRHQDLWDNWKPNEDIE